MDALPDALLASPQPGVVDRLLSEITCDGIVTDLRIGVFWTAVAVDTAAGTRAGLASTQTVHDLSHGQPAVRNAGNLIGSCALDLAQLAGSGLPTERSIGFATLNALLQVDRKQVTDRNAEELILARCASRSVAIVGHFPFVPRVRERAERCWVLELNPGEGDLAAEKAPEVIPQADVVAITGMTLLNGTFEPLAALCRPEAYVVLLGASTPLAPLLYDYGVSAISGVLVDDIKTVLAGVSQGANFRQICGKRLVTMEQA